MGKKDFGKAQKKKLTKKEQKAINHLKLIHGKKEDASTPVASNDNYQSNKKAA